MDPDLRPKKVTVWLPTYAQRALREEAFRRGVPMGAIVLEALQSRVVFVGNLKEEKGETK
jgi:hypothetical protein